MGKEVYGTYTIPVRKSFNAAHALWLFPNGVRPNVSVCKFVFFCLHRFCKPWMLKCCVPWNQVQEHVHMANMSLFKKILQVFISTVAGCHLVIIRNIITSIAKRRVKTWVNPNCVTTQVTDVVQLAYDSIYITNSVPV